HASSYASLQRSTVMASLQMLFIDASRLIEALIQLLVPSMHSCLPRKLLCSYSMAVLSSTGCTLASPKDAMSCRSIFSILHNSHVIPSNVSTEKSLAIDAAIERMASSLAGAHISLISVVMEAYLRCTSASWREGSGMPLRDCSKTSRSVTAC